MSEFRPSRFEILPTVIKNLLIINGLVFLAQYTLDQTGGKEINDKVNDLFALHYWGSDLFKPYQFITHMFMHSTDNYAHIFMNMFTLWMFGATLENIWGPKRFLIFYLVCGLGAALCYQGVLTYENISLSKDIHAYLASPSASNFALLHKKYDLTIDGLELSYPTSPDAIKAGKIFLEVYLNRLHNASVIGASGAVYGILFAFGYLFPNSLIYLYFMFPIKAKYIVGFMIVVELISSIQNANGDNVAHSAHLGGVLFSFILLKTWNRKNRQHFY